MLNPNQLDPALSGMGRPDSLAAKAPRRRSVGVAFLAVANTLGALFIAVATCYIFIVGNRTVYDAVGPELCLLPVQAMLGAVLGYGLWNLKRWAPIVGVIMYGTSAVLYLLEASIDPQAVSTLREIISVLLRTIIALAIMFYLSRPTVRAAFRY